VSEPAPLQPVDRTYVLSEGRKLSYFSGCDYLRLSSHPRIRRALQTGARAFGASVAASRMTTGNHELYLELERLLVDFFQVEDALLLPTGYVTNLAVAQALRGMFSHALIDERAHPTLADAAQFLDCPILKFTHRDPAAVAAATRRCGPQARILLLTDGLFARDGSVAPIDDYLGVLPPDALLLVDDAHGAGILGGRGRGTADYLGVNRRRLIQTITLSKAFGTYGGAILSTRNLRRRVATRSDLFIGSTPLPLPLVYAACAAVRLLANDGSFRRRLEANADRVKTTLRQAGLVLPPAPGPILPLLPKTTSNASALQKRLLKHRIFPPLIKYPGGPARGFFRFVICSEHTQQQLDALLSAILPVADQFLPLETL
jgi:7-keto-8-aminopelargonate synthetase-like enzyme